MNPAYLDQRQVIIVEDDPDDRLVIQCAFETIKMRHPLIFLKNGGEALEYFFKSSGACQTASLILLDMFLPDAQGIELLKALRENRHTRHIPVIILTHCTEDELVLKSYSHGANSYIFKEGSFERFRDKIQCLAEYWLDHAQLPAPFKTSA